MPRLDVGNQLQEMTTKLAHLEAESARQVQTTKKIKEDFTTVQFEARKWRETTYQHSANLSKLRDKEKIGLAQIGQISHERDRAIEEVSNLQALVVHSEAKMQEAQRYSDALSKVIHQQA